MIVNLDKTHNNAIHSCILKKKKNNINNMNNMIHMIQLIEIFFP